MTTIDPSTNATIPQTSALDALVGPDKKFGSAEDLAKGKLESDSFIAKLTGENRDLRGLIADLDKRLGTAEARVSILDRLETNPSVANPNAPVSAPPAPPAVKGLTEDDVLKLVERRDAESQAAINKREVEKVLFKQLSDKAGGFLLQKAAELGIDPAVLNKLALTSPKAFFATVGIDPSQTDSGTLYNKSTGLVGPSNKPAELRNYAWYEAKKAALGVKKFSMDTKLQLDMHKDMQNLGDAFFA